MSTGATVAIIVVIVIIAVAAFSAMAARRRRLRQRFGPEYERVVADQQSRRKAAAELAGRERRVRKLGIRPLTPAARAEYAAQWASIQERFVDEPVRAMTRAQHLVAAVLQDRGYPREGHDQILADLSVEHARNLEHYRAAYAISDSAASGSASTEDLRQAMIHYRAMFDDLLGAVADQGSRAGTRQSAAQPDADAAYPVGAAASSGQAAAVSDGEVTSSDQAGADPVASDAVASDPVASDAAVRGQRTGDARY